MPHAKFKKALVCKGPSNCGKSLVPEIASELVGKDAVCQLGVEHMDDPQRRSILKGKALNVITELSADAIIKDDGFKTLVSTEEPIMIDQKYKPTDAAYTPTAKHIIATNTLPRINDKTEATLGRLLIIVFSRVFSASEQNTGLKAAPRAARHLVLGSGWREAPNRARWYLRGSSGSAPRAGRAARGIESDHDVFARADQARRDLRHSALDLGGPLQPVGRTSKLDHHEGSWPDAAECRPGGERGPFTKAYGESGHLSGGLRAVLRAIDADGGASRRGRSQFPRGHG
jgi:uncharacterized protein DUF5906